MPLSPRLVLTPPARCSFPAFPLRLKKKAEGHRPSVSAFQAFLLQAVNRGLNLITVKTEDLCDIQIGKLEFWEYHRQSFHNPLFVPQLSEGGTSGAFGSGDAGTVSVTSSRARLKLLIG